MKSSLPDSLLLLISFFLVSCSGDNQHHSEERYQLTTNISPANSENVFRQSGTSQAHEEISLEAIPFEHAGKRGAAGTNNTGNTIFIYVKDDNAEFFT